MRTSARFRTSVITLSAVCVALSVYMLVHSLSGTPLLGCSAAAGGCDSVTGGRWGYFLGNVPVSLPSTAVYALLMLCVLFSSSDISSSSKSDRMIWFLMLFTAGCMVGAALWFSALQFFVLHSFCVFCMSLHIIGCLCAVQVLRYAPIRRWPAFTAGLTAAAMFAAFQVVTVPGYLYDEGGTDSPLPVISSSEMYSVGSDTASREIILLYDFQCPHCRRLHHILPEACAAADVRVILCPVPLSADCNPYIPPDVQDRFHGSCQLTRLALAVWFARSESYPDFERRVTGDEGSPSPESAARMAEELLGGPQMLDTALSDTRIDDYLRQVYELFGRTSSSGKSGIPRFICGQKWIVPETESAEGLAELLRNMK